MSRNHTVYDCSVLQLPKIQDRAGNITPVESNVDVPFSVKRVFYLYDVPGGQSRGGHAHRQCLQLIVAASGSFDVILKDGSNTRYISLNRPYMGLLVEAGIWNELMNFSSGAVCLVLTSELYDESDYIRNYESFQSYKSI